MESTKSARFRFPDIFDHLQHDHEHLLDSLRGLIKASDSADSRWPELKADLEAHLKTEEELLYAKVAAGADDLVAEGRRQHAAITALLDAMRKVPGSTREWTVTLRELETALERHFGYEESQLFVAARGVLKPGEAQQLVEAVAASETDKKAMAEEPHALARETRQRSSAGDS